MKIELSKTQLEVLIDCLKEHISIEQDNTCTDCYKDDRFYKLTKQEQEEAIKFQQEKEPGRDRPSSYTAAEYLLKIMKDNKKAYYG